MKETQSSIHYNYTASKSKPAQPMTDAALPLYAPYDHVFQTLNTVRSSCAVIILRQYTYRTIEEGKGR